jgi:hypothetical protein
MNGSRTVAPVDRKNAIVCAPFAASPARVDALALNIIPTPFQKTAPFLPPRATASSAWAIASLNLPQNNCVNHVTVSANSRVAAWPIWRASWSAFADLLVQV